MRGIFGGVLSSQVIMYVCYGTKSWGKDVFLNTGVVWQYTFSMLIQYGCSLAMASNM